MLASWLPQTDAEWGAAAIGFLVTAVVWYLMSIAGSLEKLAEAKKKEQEAKAKEEAEQKEFSRGMHTTLVPEHSCEGKGEV